MRTTVPSTTSPCLKLLMSASCSARSSSIVVGSGPRSAARAGSARRRGAAAVGDGASLRRRAASAVGGPRRRPARPRRARRRRLGAPGSAAGAGSAGSAVGAAAACRLGRAAVGGSAAGVGGRDGLGERLRRRRRRRARPALPRSVDRRWSSGGLVGDGTSRRSARALVSGEALASSSAPSRPAALRSRSCLLSMVSPGNQRTARAHARAVRCDRMVSSSLRWASVRSFDRVGSAGVCMFPCGPAHRTTRRGACSRARLDRAS